MPKPDEPQVVLTPEQAAMIVPRSVRIGPLEAEPLAYTLQSGTVPDESERPDG